MSNPDKFRSRSYVAVLYPEDSSHVECIEKLKSGGYNFAGILHNEDVYEDGDRKGEKKKEHWHIVVRFKNAVWNTAVAKELGITPNYLEACKNVDASLLYLVHYGNDEKAQYDYEKVFGPLSTRLNTLLTDNDETTRVMNIYDFIRNSPGIVTYSEIFEKALSAGLYGDFRRMGSGVSFLINDHNYALTHEEQSNAGVYVSAEAFKDYLKWTGSKTDDIQPL